MTTFEAALLGVLQGVTEFLPVSSSGHLAVAQVWLEAGSSDERLAFDVVVHLGTAAATAFAYRGRLARMARAFAPGAGSPRDALERRVAFLLALACLPTAAVGLALEGAARAALERPRLVGLAWLATAAILLVAERSRRGTRTLRGLRAPDALWVGFAQGLAVLPGISRSGITVAAALLRGLGPAASVEFSLLAGLPAIVGANVVVPLLAAEPIRVPVASLAVGFAAAAASGLLALRALQWTVVHRRLWIFAAYCGLAGVGAALLGTP